MKARVLWQGCVVAALGCLTNGIALAQSTVDCSAVTDDNARLKCYDEQAAQRKKQTTAPATTTSPAASAAAPAADFGLNADAIRKRQEAANPNTPKEPDQIVARVKAVATKPRGEYRITLEGGQVWEETQHSSTNVAPNVGETVTIKRGLLGSYFLSHSAGLALRVKRTD